MRRVLGPVLLAALVAATPCAAAARRKPAGRPPAAAKPPAKPPVAKPPVAKPPAAKPEPAPDPAAPLPGEPPLFAVFRTVCVAHQGDLAAAEREARRQGFETVPPSPEEDPATASLRTVLRLDRDGLQAVVLLLHAPPEVVANAPNAEVTLCGVAGPDAGGAAAAAAKAWVAMPSNSQDGNHLTFLYRQAGDQKLPLPDLGDASVRAAVAASEYRVFDIDSEVEGVTLGLMTGRTLPAKP